MIDGALDRYEIIDKIGEGIYGTVFKVKDKKSKKLYALKKVKMDNEDDGIPSTTIREICLLKDVDNENIVKLYNIIHWNRKLYLLFELGDFDLEEFLAIR